MIIIFLVITFACFIAHFFVKEYYSFSLSIILFAFGVLGLIGIFMIAPSYHDGKTLEFKNTVSKEEFSIENYEKIDARIGSESKDKESVITYTYTVENTNDKKVISEEDDKVYSISVSTPSKNINHLTVKNNSYFDWATFLTTEKYKYVFSSK